MADQPKPTDPTTQPYADLAQALHGDYIQDGDEDNVAKQVAALRDAIKQINAVSLANADEPAPRFAAYRADA